MDRLALDGVRVADDRALGHGGVRIDGVLDFGGTEAVAADVDHVVDPPNDAVHPVGIAPGAVTSEVLAFEGTEVDVAAALVVAVGGADHRRPRARDTEVALGLPLHRVPVSVHEDRLDAGERQAGVGRLHRAVGAEAADQDAARLGLPPGVDERAPAAADDIVVPLPRLLVDGLPHRSDDLQCGQVVSLREAGLAGHQGADGRGRGVELIDLQLLADLPKAGRRRPGRDALKHDGRGAVEHRSVDDVAVAGDPADVRGAPIHVARLVLEDVGEAVARIDHVAPAGVDHALGLARTAGGVEDEQEVFRGHPLGWAVG